jgi:hypothetical protein
LVVVGDSRKSEKPDEFFEPVLHAAGQPVGGHQRFQLRHLSTGKVSLNVQKTH